MFEPVQSVGWQVEVPPLEQMQACDTVVVPSVMFCASFEAAVWIPAVSPAVLGFCAPYCTPAMAAFDTSMDA
jgi:hypothetical protein